MLKSFVPSKKVTWSSVFSCVVKERSVLLFLKNFKEFNPINLLADPNPEVFIISVLSSPWG